MNMKITQKQKKIFMTAAIIGAVYLLFIIFVHIPMIHKLAVLKSDYDRTISEINQIKAMVGGDKSLENTINKLNQQLEKLNTMFPSTEEGILNILSDTAAKFKINVISMNPEKKHIVEEIGKTPVAIKECKVQEMEVSMVLKADYKTVNDFVRTIRQDFPVYIKFDYIKMDKVQESDGRHPILNIDLKMHAYLVCPQ